jgi:ribosomal protein S18 acetylase RimI-like enzyme
LPEARAANKARLADPAPARDAHRVRDDELLERADLNFAAWLGEQSRWCAGGERRDTSDGLYVASATRLPAGPFNAAIAVGGAAGRALLDEARAWFAARGRGFTIYVRGARDAALLDACRAAGLAQLGDMPGMVLAEAPPAVAGVELVGDDAGRASFVDVSLAAWEAAGLKPEALRKHFAAPERLRGPDVAMVLARASDGRPLATALALLSHEIAGLYWVGTRPEARGRGLGAAVTVGATRWAFERGARAVVLQASVQGEPIYRRLGFREITRYPWLVAPLSRA